MTGEVKIYETTKFTNFLLIVILILLVVFLVIYIIVARRAETVVVETTNIVTNAFRPFAQFMQTLNNDLQSLPTAAQQLLNAPQVQAIVNNSQPLIAEFEQDLALILNRIQELFSKKSNIKGKKHIVEAHMHQFNDLLNDIEKSLDDKDDLTKEKVEEFHIHFQTIYDSLYKNTNSKYLKFLDLKNKL